MAIEFFEVGAAEVRAAQRRNRKLMAMTGVVFLIAICVGLSFVFGADAIECPIDHCRRVGVSSDARDCSKAVCQDCGELQISGNLQSCIPKTKDGHYKAAYPIHKVVNPCSLNSEGCGKLQKKANLDLYAQYAEEASRHGAQIIVFPEYGITGTSSYPKASWVSQGYTEVIPEAGNQPNGKPCIPAVHCGPPGSIEERAPSIVRLSSIARKFKIAIVANLIDYQKEKMYNTDVAFDTDGSFIAKYHKQNLWGEGNIDTPEHCTEATFETSFGVKFGMFTCADLIYKHPAVDMVEKGVENFVVPMAWSSEMASLQAMPYAQGWSGAHSVNIITSNLDGWTASTSDSGIWTAGHTLANGRDVARHTDTESDNVWVVIAEVPDTPKKHNLSKRPSSTKVIGRSESDIWSFVELSVGRVCSGSVCCDAHADAAGSKGYVLAALDGIDGEAGVDSFPAQVCAVLPCSSPGTSCLNLDPRSLDEGHLKSVRLEMSGVSDDAALVPEVWAAGGERGQTLLNPEATGAAGVEGDGGFRFSPTDNGGKAILEASLSKNATSLSLGSVMLYGRRFSEDELPYACPRMEHHGSNVLV